jgi:hypothetical protein
MRALSGGPWAASRVDLASWSLFSDVHVPRSGSGRGCSWRRERRGRGTPGAPGARVHVRLGSGLDGRPGGARTVECRWDDTATSAMRPRIFEEIAHRAHDRLPCQRERLPRPRPGRPRHPWRPRGGYREDPHVQEGHGDVTDRRAWVPARASGCRAACAIGTAQLCPRHGRSDPSPRSAPATSPHRTRTASSAPDNGERAVVPHAC